MSIEHANPGVARTGNIIADHLDKISRLFKPGAKLTIVVRRPDMPDGSQDMIISDDTVDDVIAALGRWKVTEKVTQ